MDCTMTDPSALSFKFGNFSPSDRRALLELFKSKEGEEVFIKALVIYLEGWANADWLEVYSVEIIGEWVAKKAPSSVQSGLKKIVASKIRSAKPNRRNTYLALRQGLDLLSGHKSAELHAQH
jgi:hypothetical protein